MPGVKPRLGDPARTVAIRAFEPFDPRFRATEFALAATCRALHHAVVLLFFMLVHRLPLHASFKGSGDMATYLVAVSYTHLRAHETRHDLVCRLLLEKK